MTAVIDGTNGITSPGIVGVTDGSNALAGTVGEYVSSAVSVTTTGATSGTYQNVTSISLTAGDWDVWGSIQINGASTTIFSTLNGCISTTSATFSGTTGYNTSIILSITQNNLAFAPCVPVAPQRLSLSTTTIVYLVMYPLFSVSTAGLGGFIAARRRR